nr:mucin-like protein 3 [Manis javanica]
MAQPAYWVRSICGLQCCLLLLLASRKAGATALQGLQKTGESPTSNHLFPPAPGPGCSAFSDYTAPHSGHSSLDLLKLKEPSTPKHHCNTTHSSQRFNKTIDNSKNSTTHHIVYDIPHSSNQNSGHQRKNPIIQNGQSVDPKSTNTHKGSSGTKYPTAAPKRKTTCKTKTGKPIVRSTANIGRTLEKDNRKNITFNSTHSTSHQTVTPSHKSANTEIKKLTSSSEKISPAMRISHNETRSPKSSGVEEHKTDSNHITVLASDKTPRMITVYTEKIAPAVEKTTQTPSNSTKQRPKTTSANCKTTRAKVNTLNPGEKSLSADEKTTKSTVKPPERRTVRSTANIGRTQEKDNRKNITFNSTPSTSHQTVTPSRKSVNTENDTRSPKMTTFAQKKTARVSTKSTRVEQETTSAFEKITPSPGKLMEHKDKTTWANETTRAPAKSTKCTKIGEKGTSATEIIKPAENPGKNTAATETVTPLVKVTRDKSITTISPRPNKTNLTHQLLTGYIKFTSMLETPGNKSHPNHNKGDSQGGLHAAEVRENPFPAWAIVVVVLLAVILFLVFLGLIFLIFYLMKTRRALIQNTDPEENYPENEGGPNSYPVYLMEQQNLSMGQIPLPR